MATFNITTGVDDGYEEIGGSFVDTATRLDIGHNTAYQCTTYFRYSSVAIPQGATIVDAKITVKSLNNQSGTTCSTTIKGDDVDNSATFTSSAKPSGRTPTTATVAWTNLPAFTTDTTYDTPDITDIIQEIVDRPGWSSGNALSIMMFSTVSTPDARRNLHSYETNGLNYSNALTVNFISVGGAMTTNTSYWGT